jgi:hypothetical protein
MLTAYDTDYHAWALEQARRIRAGESVDVAHIAEELESLGRKEQNALTSHMIVLLAHLIKWEFQPDHRSRSWSNTIRAQRKSIEQLLVRMPSLRTKLPEVVSDSYDIATIRASEEIGTMAPEEFPARCPYSESQILTESLEGE